MDNSSLLKIAYNDFIEELFGENLGDVTQRMVTRKDYKQALQKINKKYQLEQGHPKFIEWTLILLARSPRFIDNQSNQRRPTCSLPDEWKPKYTQDLISKLKDPNMVSICGEWVIGTLSSSLYWNHLRRRLDFLAFAIIEEGRTNGEMCPRELDPITADSLFSYLVEPQIKKSSKRRGDYKL